MIRNKHTTKSTTLPFCKVSQLELMPEGFDDAGEFVKESMGDFRGCKRLWRTITPAVHYINILPDRYLPVRVKRDNEEKCI